VFDIDFTREEAELQEEGWYGLWGRITLADHTEDFLAPLGPWQRRDYERQWIEAARRLLGNGDRTAFFTDAFRFWWTMWREGERVYVHEEFLVGGRLTGVTDFTTTPYALIQDRATHTEDGQRISEWEISTGEVREFVERRAPFLRPRLTYVSVKALGDNRTLRQ
jgi:hypothetical protein